MYEKAPKVGKSAKTAVFVNLAVLLLVTASFGVGPADDAYAEAQGAERTLDFARALAAYRRAFELDPAGPHASAARTRAEALEAQSEGGFGPLRALEAARRDGAILASPPRLEAFAREAEGFARGPVRDEARLLAAERLVRRLDAPGAGLLVSKALADDASASSAARAQAALLAVEATAALEGDASAARLARRFGAPTAEEARRYERRVWWRRGRASSAAVLGALAAASLAGAARVGRAAWRAYAAARVPALLVGAVIAAGASIASSLSPGASFEPFAALGAGVVAVDAAVALVRRAWPGARWSRPLALAFGTLGVASAAYLALAWRDPLYLESLLGWS
jgi:hypothetical protein